jgi:leucyl-tRNA synthetase
VLKEHGLVDYKEPFTRLLTQGMVCKETMSCIQHGFLLPDEVEIRGTKRFCSKCGKEAVEGRVEKMSKSKKNIIDPNTMLEKYGADTTRLFCLFAAPPERDLEWSEQGVEGGYRFLNRVWRLVFNHLDGIKDAVSFCGDPDLLKSQVRDLYKQTHQTIKKVTKDIEERFHFNTVISAVMALVNTMSGLDPNVHSPEKPGVIRFSLESVVQLLSPMVPHFSEELWKALGHESSIFLTPWPSFRKDALERDDLLIVVQVNGKLRSRFNVPSDEDESVIKDRALSDERVSKFINGKPIKRVIVVKKKLVNIVV